jgi:cephalosporin hydroxylase
MRRRYHGIHLIDWMVTNGYCRAMTAGWLRVVVSSSLLLGLGQCSKPKSPDDALVTSFNRYYLEGPGARKRVFDSKFLGVSLIQAPTDMWMFQEIITEVRPDLVIETGTANGGSAVFFAALLEQVNPEGKVITIDIKPMLDASIQKLASPLREQVDALAKRRIEVIRSNSVEPSLIESLAARAKGKTVLVTLDSSHCVDHVANELKLYSPLVSKGSYLVVQDTRLDDDPDWVKKWTGCPEGHHLGGPTEAVKEFLQSHSEFQVDRERERFLLTWYPGGYLKRIR